MCSYFGKILFCCELFIEKGVKCVVIVIFDCNLFVFGNGKRRLEEVRIEVMIGVFEVEVVLLNCYFFYYMKMKCFFVIIKIVMSLDGKIVIVIGESKWIIGEEVCVDVY